MVMDTNHGDAWQSYEWGVMDKRSSKIKAPLVFPDYVKSALGAVVVLVQALGGHEGDAAARRAAAPAPQAAPAQEDRCCPHECGVSRFMVQDRHHIHLAAGALRSNRVLIVNRPKLNGEYAWTTGWGWCW